MRDLSERLLWAAEHAPVIDTAIHADIERAARARIAELEAEVADYDRKVVALLDQRHDHETRIAELEAALRDIRKAAAVQDQGKIFEIARKALGEAE